MYTSITETQAAPEPTRKPALGLALSLHILVADDHYANRLLAQSLLQRQGHSIELAHDGKQAWELSREQVFDLILLDIQMPVMDGYAALKAIRTTQNRNKPIFALTAYTGVLEVAEMKNRGFQAVLKKPFRIDDMMAHLNTPPVTSSVEIAPPPAPPINLRTIYADTLDMNFLEIRTLDILIQAIGIERMGDVLRAYWVDFNMLQTILQKHFPQNTAASVDDILEIRKASHGLKGMCANLGLKKASQVSALLQHAPEEHFRFLIDTFNATLVESKNALLQYCAYKAPGIKVS